jgi:hypothetical protein
MDILDFLTPMPKENTIENIEVFAPNNKKLKLYNFTIPLPTVVQVIAKSYKEAWLELDKTYHFKKREF